MKELESTRAGRKGSKDSGIELVQEALEVADKILVALKSASLDDPSAARARPMSAGGRVLRQPATG